MQNEKASRPSKIARQAYKIITSSISNWTLWTVSCSWREFSHCLLLSFHKDTHTHTHQLNSFNFWLRVFRGCLKMVDFLFDADEGSIFCPAHTHSHNSWHKHQSSQASWLYCNMECGKPQDLKSISGRGHVGMLLFCKYVLFFFIPVFSYFCVVTTAPN